MIQNLLVWLIQISLCLFLFHCSVGEKFSFSPKEKKLPYKNIPKSLAFETFQDLRPEDKKTRTGYIFIPFVFWETNESNKRKTDELLYGKKDFALTQGLKKELLSYKNLNEVYIASETDNSKDADYLVRGKILKTFYKNTFTLYGFSIFGIFLFPLGLPIEHFYFETYTEFELVEVKTNKILLTKKNPRKDSSLRNVYMKSYHNTIIKIWQNQLESFAKDCMDVLRK
ncbi:MAG: hypothetical protein IPL26_18605 [Leptospiraceae bacterium]|nr:hypothetical protein [Leptospiraceae bacterium]